MTNEQIEQKKQQLKGELAEAGAIELSDDAIDQVAGGVPPGYLSMPTPPSPTNLP